MATVSPSALVTGLSLLMAFYSTSAATELENREEADCSCYMCQNEKGSIDALIIEYARR